MRKLIIVAAFALAAPSAAVADDKTGGKAERADKAAKQACQAEKRGMGTKVFKKTYAAKSTSKAMSACVAAQAQETDDKA